MELVRPKTIDETSGRSSSVLVPETPVAESSKTDLEKLKRPAAESETQKTLGETSGRSGAGSSQAANGETGNDADKTGATPENNADQSPATKSDGSTTDSDVVPNVDMPDDEPSRTGDENAADRT